MCFIIMEIMQNNAKKSKLPMILNTTNKHYNIFSLFNI